MWRPLYSVFSAELVVIKELLEENTCKGFISQSSSSLPVPVGIAKRPDGGL
jgi:hypothetical protein